MMKKVIKWTLIVIITILLLGVLFFIWFLGKASIIKDCWSESYSQVTNTKQEEFPPKNMIKVDEKTAAQAQKLYVECLEKKNM